MSETYKSAGVDIEAGDALVERIRPMAKRTLRPEVLSGIGGFGAQVALPLGKYREPILVSGTDGVGTKLKLAFLLDQHHTIGIDLVAMSVNDVVTSGAEPLFFLDYFATSKLNANQAARVVEGIALGCERAGCALVGGETAEMPGMYAAGEYDLAGFCVGVVEKSKRITGQAIAPGDAVVGIASSGLHSNGYSLARRVLVDNRAVSLGRSIDGMEKPLGDALLEPTKIYVKPVLELMERVSVKGLAHITGSGIPGNLPRCLPAGTRAVLDERKWQRSPLFSFVQREGNIARDEMYATFNMGLGMLAVVSAADAPAAVRALKALGETAWEVGEIVASEPGAEATVEILE